MKWDILNFQQNGDYRRTSRIPATPAIMVPVRTVRGESGDFAVAAGAADPITPDTGRTTSITVRKTIQRTMPREKVFFIAETASRS